MRTIKFRAWHIEEKKMIYQHPYESFHWFWITADGNVYRDGKFQVLELMQFTGLKDKNGVDCYEGDKLEHETYGCGFVEYDVENASFFVWFGDSKDNDDWNFLARVIKESKIIGNIHTDEQANNIKTETSEPGAGTTSTGSEHKPDGD